jgi:hypothetical protein
MICANEGCENKFEKTTHNQKYCSDECCREATNRKIREKYYAEKDRLSGKKRVCNTRGCTNLLSRYNESETCRECLAKKENKNRNELLRIFNVSG